MAEDPREEIVIIDLQGDVKNPPDPLANLQGEEQLSESSGGAPKNPPKKRKSTRRQQKYRKAWEYYPEFSQWLGSVENDVYKARCGVCAKTLVADLSVLQAHANAIRHHSNLERYLKAQTTLDLLETKGKAKEPKKSTGELLQKEVNDLDLDRLSIADPEASDGAYESSSGMIQLDMSHSQSTSHGRPKPTAEPTAHHSKAIVTKPAPPWRATAIVNGHVTRLELSDYKGRYLVLFFYPQDFSAVCPTELQALSDRIPEFRAIQTEVVACSVDSHLTHLAWARLPRSEGGLGNPKIPLLADPTHSIARDYGVLLPELGHSLRAHFIIDRRGILRHSLVNDISVGRSIDEILRVTQALQHVDDTETGCPVDWKPGEPSV